MHKTILLAALIIICTFFSGCQENKPKNTDTQLSTAQSSRPDDTIKTIPGSSEKSAPAETQAVKITEKDAIEKVSELVGPLPKGYYISFDHIGTENNVEYYVIHHYEVVIDDPKTGVGHTVTYGWYFVDSNSGEIYEMDIATGKLKKPTAEKPADTGVSYKLYTNSRFGFSIEYLDTYVTKVLPDNGDGIVLADPDGSAELTVSGINNVLSETVSSLYKNLISQYRPSYKMLQGNWFVASWMEGDRIVYEKCVVGSGSINTFIIKYPADKKEAYDIIVAHLVSTFKTPSIDEFH